MVFLFILFIYLFIHIEYKASPIILDLIRHDLKLSSRCRVIQLTGPDGIFSALLQRPVKLLSSLVKLFRTCLFLGIPTNWRISKVVDIASAKDHRPISFSALKT